MRNFNQHRIWYCCNWLVISTTVPSSVASIKNIINLLKDSYSDMAIRNLLTDLVRELIVFQQLTPPTHPQELIDGKNEIIAEVLERAYEELGVREPSIGRYKKALCLGYCVKTVGDEYKGKEDDRNDMIQRVEWIKDAITKAHGLARSFATETDVLKIFMAPEFFFRGRNGAYDHEVVHGDGKNPGIMDLLRTTLDLPAYKDWLFVLGTTVAASKSTEFTCDECSEKCDFHRHGNKTIAVCKNDRTHQVSEKTLGAVVENVALIKKEDVCHTVTKELISDVDYLLGKIRMQPSGETLKVEKTSLPSDYFGADNKPSKFTDERMGGSVFTIDGITFGLEVCLDHAASENSPNEGRLQHAANIQVQLIPSGGISIKKLRTVPNGIVFNVDGDTPHVSVIAGDKTDVQLSVEREKKHHFNFLNFKKKYELHVLTGSIAKNAPKWSELEAKGIKTDGLKFTPSPAPKFGSAAKGRVVMHGPYNIP